MLACRGNHGRSCLITFVLVLVVEGKLIILAELGGIDLSISAVYL